MPINLNTHYIMDDQDFENLAKRWPDLFQKSGDFELSVGRGWYTIIDILFGMISCDVERAKQRLKYAIETPNCIMKESIEELEANVAKALDDLPAISQVKEKFGSLRIYINGKQDSRLDSYIEFAEAISGRTCEVCGSPGSKNNNGWIRTLCKHHLQEDEEQNR